MRLTITTVRDLASDDFTVFFNELPMYVVQVENLIDAIGALEDMLKKHDNTGRIYEIDKSNLINYVYSEGEYWQQ